MRERHLLILAVLICILYLPLLAFAGTQKSSTLTYLEELHSQGKERVIVKFKDKIDPNIITSYNGKVIRDLRIINAVVCEIDKSSIDLLKKEEAVSDVVVDAVISVPTPIERELNLQEIETLVYDGNATVRWNNLQAGLNSKAAWNNYDLDGTGVKIAFLDTGINYTLENLDDNYLGGYDFVDDDNDPMPVLDQTEDHGTAVTSLAVGEGVNKVVGAAYSASYYAVRVAASDVGGGYVSDCIAGINWASTEPHKADVISMSFGTYGGGPLWNTIKPIFENACNNAYNAGVILVAGSGNNGYDYSAWPARFNNVISVGGHAEDQTLYDYGSGSTNGGVDIIAPAERVYTVGADNTGWLYSGTSIATPHASALIALQLQYARQHNIEINNGYLWEVMKHSAVDLGFDEVWQGKGKIYASQTDINDANIGSIDLIVCNWPIDYQFEFSDYAFIDSNYPVYQIGQDVNQTITLTNITDLLGNQVETIEDINVVATHIYFGEPNEPNLPGNSVIVFPIITYLEPNEANSITLSCSYTIPQGITPGMNKTKLELEFNFLGNDRALKVSFNEPNSLWYSAIPGDLNVSDDIDFEDFAIFALSWRQSDCTEPNWCNRADIDKSGEVDVSDLNIIADKWLAGL